MPTKHDITIKRRKNITQESAEGEELLMVTMTAMPKIRYYCYGKPAGRRPSASNMSVIVIVIVIVRDCERG